MSNEPEMKFDPMTGEPIQKKPEMKFDPMTGEPIKKEQNEFFQQQPVQNGPVMPSGKKSRKWVLPVAIVAGVVVIGGVGAAAATTVVPRVMYGKNYKILNAIQNTEGSSSIMKNLMPSGKIRQDTCQFDLDAKMDNYGSISLSGVQDPKKKQASMNMDVDLTSLNTKFGLDMQIKDDILTLQSDDIMKGSTFSYDYSKGAKTDGYIGEMMSTGNFTQEDLNAYLRESMVFDKDVSKMPEEFWDATKSEINEMDFTGADSEKYEMDGEDVNCKGYKTTITKKEMKHLVKAYKEVVKKYYSDKMLEIMKTNGTSLDDAFDSLEGELDDMDDIKTTLYIGKKGFFGKNRVAACKIESEGKEVLFELKGGNYPLENFKITSPAGESVERKGEVNGSKEKAKYVVDGTTVLDYTYDTEDGDFKVSAQAEGSEMSLEGKLTSTDDEYSVKVDQLKLPGLDYDISLSYTAKAGGNFKELSKGSEEYKLESMSGDQFQQMAVKMYQDPFFQKIYSVMNSLNTSDGPTSMFGGGSTDTYGSDDSYDYDSDSTYGSDDSYDYDSDSTYGSDDNYDFDTDSY